MGMLDTIRSRSNSALKGLGDAWTRTKNSDFLPAFASAMGLMVAADGKIEQSEIDGVMDFVNNDPTLAAWKPEVRTAAFETALEAASKGIMRQASLFGNIGKLKGKAEAETLIQLVLALAYQDGEFADAEKKMFERICTTLGKKASDYLS